MGRPYGNYSKQYHAYFQSNRKEELEGINALKAKAASYKPAKGAYSRLTGTYSNPVYGKIAIEGKDDRAEVSFEFHPDYKGKVRFISDKSCVIEYNDPTLGMHEIGFTDNSIEIKVSEFIDMDTYLFTKISSTFQAFPAQ